MEPHRRIARAHTAIAAFYLLLMLVFGWLWAGDGFSRSAILAYPTAVFAALFLAHALVARGARAARPWARTVSVVIALPLLAGFPIGTIIGVYLIAYAWKPWTDVATAGASRGATVTGAG